MGQCWYILDLDAETTLLNGGKMREFFWDDDLVPDIAKQLRLALFSTRVDELLQGTILDQGGSPFRHLSQELFDLIFDELKHTKRMKGTKFYHRCSFFALAVTCKAVLARARNHVAKLTSALTPQTLAGHRIICVGDYTDPLSDLPPGVLTSEEISDIEDFAEEDDSSPNFLDHMLYRFENPRNIQVWDPHRPAVPRLDDWPDRNDRALGNSIIYPYYSAGRTWALRSLTKHEYVRGDAAWKLCESLPHWDSGGQINKAQLSHFFLINICCSGSPDDHSLRYEGNLGRGRWAGNRLDIIPLDNIAADDEGPWTDVTEETGEIVRQIWEAEYKAFQQRLW
ncbi:hypothetical protein C2E23DRAFT_730035 [Lenzites betulinus]|nr:hypothetical protein C2E23DRAFT_730035 [Lenzites betulinus]